MHLKAKASKSLKRHHDQKLYKLCVLWRHTDDCTECSCLISNSYLTFEGHGIRTHGPKQGEISALSRTQKMSG